jgi:hypothetical protein
MDEKPHRSDRRQWADPDVRRHKREDGLLGPLGSPDQHHSVLHSCQGRGMRAPPQLVAPVTLFREGVAFVVIAVALPETWLVAVA